MSFFNIAWQWLISAQQWHGPDSIPVRLVQHLEFTGIALGIAIVIALPAGLAMGHLRRGGFAVVTLANFGRALPTLGLLVLIFVLTALLSVGAAAYVLAWLFIPMADEDGTIAGRAMTDRRGIALAAAVGSLLILVLVVASIVGASWISNLSWPLVVSAAGLVLIWRNAPADEQETMRRLTEPLGAAGTRLGMTGPRKKSATIARASLTGVLLIGGLALLLSGHDGAELLRPVGGLILVVAAITVLLGPWWLRIARNLVVERQARARAEERADMASRVHDSVLQTLALIQRNANQPQEVIKLARAQERELRSWLFDGRAPGSVRGAAVTVASGVRLIQQEVEAAYGVAVEAITVGDCELDDNLDAVLAAAREATVNAAKWSGAQVVSLFAEVEPAEVSLFVRDRGCGFDPAAVPGDRKGLAESVRARVTRRGGSATVRSVPGEGTEVSLHMPRRAAERQPSRA